MMDNSCGGLYRTQYICQSPVQPRELTTDVFPLDSAIATATAVTKAFPLNPACLAYPAIWVIDKYILPPPHVHVESSTLLNVTRSAKPVQITNTVSATFRNWHNMVYVRRLLEGSPAHRALPTLARPLSIEISPCHPKDPRTLESL